MNNELTRSGNTSSLATSLRRRIHTYSISLLGILAILFCGIQSNLMAQPPQNYEYFAYGYSIPVIASPSEMVLGDFNLDGQIDMVVTSSVSEELEIFHGQLGGGFQQGNSEIFDCPLGASQGSSLDFDGDGNLDLIIRPSSGVLHVILGDGEGSFGIGFDIIISSGMNPISAVEFGDLNGDDQLDIVTASLTGSFPGGDETRLLLSDGNGDYSLSAELFPHADALAVEDVNGDGYLDLITAGGGPLTVHLNDGNANFIVSEIIGLPYGVSEIAVADFFDDQVPGFSEVDIVCLTTGGEGLGFLTGVGGGSFFADGEVHYENELSNAGDMTTVDIDGQAGPELVFVSQDSNAYLGVLTGHGSDGIPFEGFQEIPIGPDPQCLKVLDINQDGLLDVIVASNALNIIEVYLGQPPVPDFERGDANGDGQINLADAMTILGVLFQQNSPAVPCLDASDCNDDGFVDLSDPITELSYLFGGLSWLPEPFLGCGSDPTSDALDCEISQTSLCP